MTEYVTKRCCECTLVRPVQTVGIQACDECRERILAASPPHHEVEALWNPRTRSPQSWHKWVPAGDQQHTTEKTLSPEPQNSVTVPDRSAVIINYLDGDDQMYVEVVDGRGMQFEGPKE